MIMCGLPLLLPHHLENCKYLYSSVTQSCPTLCNPMDCSTPGLPVHHQLLEFAQTHVHPVSDAIQPSHPLSSPSPPAFSLSSIRVFSNESVLPIRQPKYWSFSFSISPSNECSGLISFRTDACIYSLFIRLHPFLVVAYVIFHCTAQAPEHMGSVVVQLSGSLLVVHELPSCSTRALLP